MKIFIADIFPKLQNYSQRLDNLTLLTNQHWVSIDDINTNKTVYIFRNNNELLVSTNGVVEKSKWEYLGSKSLLIDRLSESYLFKHGFFDENILALKVDSKEEYAVFVNENKYDGDLNSMERVITFLQLKYINPAIRKTVETSTGYNFDNKEKPIIYANISKSDKEIEQDNLFFIVLIIVVFVVVILIGLALNSHV